MTAENPTSPAVRVHGETGAHLMSSSSDAYRGREQSLLKHVALRGYVQAWAMKLASAGQHRPVTLWYIDCFAGPWQSRDQDQRDTSVAIGLQALNDAVRFWVEERGARVTAKAVFVEKSKKSFASLESFVGENAGVVEPVCLQGKFEDHVADIAAMVSPQDAALIFVDPKGWTGASIEVLKPLASGTRRDVVINLMSSFVSRFSGASHEWVPDNMRRLFDLSDGEVVGCASEDEVVDLYRRRLKTACGLDFAADLVVPEPLRDRTYFRLVLGTHAPIALELFRGQEAKLVGVAGDVRAQAKQRRAVERTGQGELFSATVKRDAFLDELRTRDLARLDSIVLETLAASGSAIRYEELWPLVLERCHVKKADVGAEVAALQRAERISCAPWTGQRPNDETVLHLPPSP